MLCILCYTTTVCRPLASCHVSLLRSRLGIFIEEAATVEVPQLVAFKLSLIIHGRYGSFSWFRILEREEETLQPLFWLSRRNTGASVWRRWMLSNRSDMWILDGKMIWFWPTEMGALSKNNRDIMGYNGNTLCWGCHCRPHCRTSLWHRPHLL